MKFYSKILLIISILLVPIGSLINAHAENAANGWKDIAVGGTFNLAVKQDGTLWAWGASNQSGVFGNGEKSEENLMVPVQVTGLHDVRHIAGGAHHALAVDNNGAVWAWGSNSEGQIGDGRRTVIRPGTGFMVAEDNDHAKPIVVEGIDNAVLLAGNWSESFAVTADGALWRWGLSPKRLNGFSDVISISSGYGNNLVAAKADGTVWKYYRGEARQIQGLTDVIEVADAAGHSYALKKDGSVWVFGSNGIGMIAGESINKEFEPTPVEGITDVKSIQATAGGPLYLKEDGTVWTSGNNLGGQLGIGSYEDSVVPVQVIGLHKIVKISAHGTSYRSMALREDGTLYSWGNGFTGDGTKWYRTEPVWIKSSESEIFNEHLIDVFVNDVELEFEQLPTLISGTTMVPLRKIFEALGAEIEWDGSTSTVTAVKDKTTIQLTINHDTAFVNGKPIKLQASPVIRNNITLVPVRFISESLGAKVDWRDNTKTVIIYEERI